MNILRNILIISFVLTRLETCLAIHHCVCNCFVFKVSANDGPRSVWEKIKPERIERDECIEVKFISRDSNSSVCLLQVHNISSVLDQNLELVAMDGSKEVFSLTHSSSWLKREYCSRSDYLAFRLKKLNGTIVSQLDLLNINFSILHIESWDRKLYMSENYCDETFMFRNSVVTISNQFPYIMQASSSQYCSVNLFKITNEETQFCLHYTLLHPRNKSEITWKVYVTTADSSSDQKDDLYILEANMSDTGGWCDPKYRTSIMVTYYVTFKEDSLKEPPLFTIYVADFSGGLDNFTEYLYGITASTIIIYPTMDEATLELAASVNTKTTVPIDYLTSRVSAFSSGDHQPMNVSFTTLQYQRTNNASSSSRLDISTSVSSTSSTIRSERYLISDQFTFTLFIYSTVLGSAIIIVLCVLICCLHCQKKSTKKTNQRIKPKTYQTPKVKK